MTGTIVRLYRVESQYARPRPTKAESTAALRRIALKSRVERPALLDLVTSGAFYRLPALPRAVVKSPADLQLDHQDDGWTLPESDYGRVSVPSAESLRAWVRMHLGVWVNPEDVAIVALKGGE